MKTILCYGDSNTWGIDYTTGGRVPFEDRWPNVLQSELGNHYHVIEEGLNGRTTAEDDPSDEFPEAKNGRKSLIPCIRSHYPIDLLIFMLGTNDLKTAYFTSVHSIAENIGLLVTMARKELSLKQQKAPPILIIAPSPLRSTITTSPFASAFNGEKSVTDSITMGAEIKNIAEQLSCYFLDGAAIARPNEKDAVHLSREGHHALGHAVTIKVQQIFK